MVLDKRYGMYVNNDLAQYHVPVHADIPDVDAIFLSELDNKANPLKSKGIGELGICGVSGKRCLQRLRHTRPGLSHTLDKLLAGLPAQV